MNSFSLKIKTSQIKLCPWLVIRQVNVRKWVVVWRFAKKSDADEYMNICQRKQPDGRFSVVFNKKLVAKQVSNTFTST